MGRKVCPRCGDFLLLHRFARNGARADGRHVYCRRCDSLRRHFQRIGWETDTLVLHLRTTDRAHYQAQVAGPNMAVFRLPHARSPKALLHVDNYVPALRGRWYAVHSHNGVYFAYRNPEQVQACDIGG